MTRRLLPLESPLPGRDRFGRLLDRWAIGLSALCLLHCLAVPVAIVMLPAFEPALPSADWWVHPLILLLALPLAGVALWRGLRRHRDWRPAWLGIIGLSAITAGMFVGHGNGLETLLTVIGGLTVAGAHLLNTRLDGHHHHGRGRCTADHKHFAA